MNLPIGRITALVIVVVFAQMGVGPAWAAEGEPDGQNPGSPITVELASRPGFASFTNDRHPDNRIGYRFFEHLPLELGTVPGTAAEAGLEQTEPETRKEEFLRRPGVVVYRCEIHQKQGWVDPCWTFCMAPAEDGIELLWLIETGGSGLPGYYGVQQCFRMSGKSNEAWRQEIARTPAFSEFDLWKSQAEGEPKTTLSYVVRNHRWQGLPAMEGCVGLRRTPLGTRVDKARSGGSLSEVAGPYKARMLEAVDCGLITRTNLEGTWICGLYWEGTSHVTDHHPADCLHAIVNIGGVPPDGIRAVRGKIYWFEGAKADLLERWRRDFPKTP